MQEVQLPTTNMRPYNIKIDKMPGGTNTVINPARLDSKFAVESVNLVQDQDGIWRTRPGISYYGTAISGVTSIDGATQFEKLDGTRETIAIAGGKVWKSQDKGAWTEVTGATFTAGYQPFFYQSNNQLYISNRHDPWAVYNGTSLTKYTALTTPTAPTASLTTITAGSNPNFYYIVAVNSVGFTDPSPVLSKPTNKNRDLWTGGEKAALSWSAVTNATGYEIYHGTEDGTAYYIADVDAGVTTFDDTGTADYPENTYRELPDDNTTAAPLFGPMEVSGGRFWATDDPDNKWRVYFSGTGQDFAKFSSFYNGGYVDVEIGGLNKPISVVHYRTGKGDPIITVLCSSPDGNGTTFQIDFVDLTLGGETIKIPAVYKIVGSIGADSPSGVVKVGDNIMFINQKAVNALRNKQQIFNVLSTDEITGNIRNKINGLNTSLISKSAGYYRSPRVYFSVANGSVNDTTFIYDMEHSNLNYAWNVGFNQFFEYTENTSTGDGATHFLGVLPTGNQIVEISENNFGDYGGAFYQSYISPLLPVSKDYTDKAFVQDVIIELGNFQGNVICEVLGLKADKAVASVAAKEKSSNVGTSGWGDDEFSEMFFSDTNDTPKTFAQQSTKVRVKVNEDLYGIQFHVYSTSLSKWELLGVEAKGFLKKGRPAAQWSN
jgi:hypothetical protein